MFNEFTGIPFYAEGKDLLLQAAKLWQNYSVEHARKLLKDVDASSANPFLYDYLKWKYKEEPVLERLNFTYPVAAYPAPESQIRDLNSVLIGKVAKTCPADKFLTPKSAEFRSLLVKVGDKVLQDRPTFTMDSLVTRDKLGLTCQLGSYFRSVDTCESLEWEILHKASSLQQNTEAAFLQFEKKLPLRSEVHNRNQNPVRYGLSRSAAVSISTLIACVDEGTLYLWLRKRSSSVATHPNRLHIVPSFLFQPASAFLDEEYSVVDNIYREYLEEVFDVPEPEEIESDYRYFYSDPRLLFLQKLLKSGEAELFFTGIGVSLLNLRPEICTLLLIKTEKWNKYHSQNPKPDLRFRFNMEWAKTFNTRENIGSIIARIPYRKTDKELMAETNLSPHHIVPTGAASFWLGIDLLRKLL